MHFKHVLRIGALLALVVIVFSSKQASATVIRKVRESVNSSGQRVEEWSQPANVKKLVTYQNTYGSGLVKVEYQRPDGSVRTFRYDTDGKTLSANYEVNKDGDYVEQEYYDQGKLTNSRHLRADKSLELKGYYADGKTLHVHQTWRHEPQGKGKNGRVSPYLLTSVKEYGADGQIRRELYFHPDGKKVAKDVVYDDQGGYKATTVGDDGMEISYEYGGAPGAPATIKAKKDVPFAGKDFSKLILDPHFGGNEPGVSKIYKF
ncbi:MAG: hypothetical protein K2W82_11070 [Candidatus Obscuribacterales bacterium]|nr:hypothetical protein [Candidatus Obscuribacterales bacterium]